MYKIWRHGNKAITYKKMEFNLQNMKLSERDRELKKSYTRFMKMTITVVVRQEKRMHHSQKNYKTKNIFAEFLAKLASKISQFQFDENLVQFVLQIASILGCCASAYRP